MLSLGSQNARLVEQVPRNTYLATEQSLRVLTTEPGGGRAMAVNTERTTELADMPAPGVEHLIKIHLGITQQYRNVTKESCSQLEPAMMTTMWKEEGGQPR